jgi:hypothetical protein
VDGKTYKAMAGDLSAAFHIDGEHLERFIARRHDVMRGLVEQLILHNQLLIPANDYLTLVGLVRLLGEANVTSMLQRNELRVIRLKGVQGYMRGENANGSLGVIHVQESHPTSAPPEDAAVMSFRLLGGSSAQQRQLARLAAEQTYEVPTEDALNWVRPATLVGLKKTSLWNNSYEAENGDLLLPGIDQRQVRMLGPTSDPSTNVIDAFLALYRANVDTYLTALFEADSSSTSAPFADAFELGAGSAGGLAHPLWNFLEVHGVPDISKNFLGDQKAFKRFLKLVRSQKTEDFRNWFHPNRTRTPKEIQQGYMDFMYQTPWSENALVKSTRFVLTELAGSIPMVGTMVSAFDAFYVDKILRGSSPRYFVEELRKFRGSIPRATNTD